MTEKLRVGCIGAGYFSRFHFEAWDRLDRAELAGVCDLDHDKARAAPSQWAFDDIEALIGVARPDLIDIITPPGGRLAVVQQVARHGLPMIVQKPLADDLEDATRIVEAAEGAGVPLVVHENFRFQPWYREARRLLDLGLLGRPFGVSFRLRPGDGRGADAYMGRQPYFQKMRRFLVHETGIHFVDTFRYLLGEVTAVFADLRQLNPAIAGEDTGHVLFRFADDVRGHFDGNRLSEFPAADPRLTMGEMLLEGDEARLRLDGDGHLFLKPVGQPERRHDYAFHPDRFGGGCVDAFQNHVLEHLLCGSALETSGRQYLRNLEIEEAIYRSADQGGWQTV